MLTTYNLCKFVRMPKNKDRVGRFAFLIEEYKTRSDRIRIAAEEVAALWIKLSFSMSVTESRSIPFSSFKCSNWLQQKVIYV